MSVNHIFLSFISLSFNNLWLGQLEVYKTFAAHETQLLFYLAYHFMPAKYIIIILF